MSTSEVFRKFGALFNKISPPVNVGGLHITDFAVRYVDVKGGKFIRESLRLPPGVVEGGRVKNRDALAAVLAELRIRVTPDISKSLSVVLSLPIRDVYIQVFSVPQVAEEGFEEAAELNAKMVSPIDAENAYYGWQRISEEFSASAEVNMLGAFVQRPIVDEFADVIEFAGFGIAAVEFESMSLARGVNRAKLVGAGRPHVVMQIAVEGINLVVVRRGMPHFHYFHSWSEIQGDGKTISLDKFKSALKDELSRIINFYLTHWSGEQIDDIVVITPAFGGDISNLIKEEFKGLKAQIAEPLRISAVVGAAWRGVVPRFSDNEISLSSISALGVFERQQTQNFIRIWRNILATSMGFLLLLFVASNIFLRVQMAGLLDDQRSILVNPDVEEYTALSEKANEFNRLIAMARSIKAGNIETSSFLKEIDRAAGPDIGITRIDYNPPSVGIVLRGTAPNESSAVDFKNRIAEVPQFSNVNLPLHNISNEGEGVSFNLDFKVISFDFAE